MTPIASAGGLSRCTANRAKQAANTAAQARKLAMPRGIRLFAALVTYGDLHRGRRIGDTLYTIGRWKTATYEAKSRKQRSARITIPACQTCGGAGESRSPSSLRSSTA